MSTGGGDLVTILSLEDFEFRTGLREAAAETKRFGDATEQMGERMEHSLHRPIHRGAHLAGSFAFMLAENKGVEDMKGKFESLTMMAPAIGLAIGGWAGPLGIAAGIAGAALVPKILEGKKAFDDVAESIKEAGVRLEQFMKRGEAMIDFKAKLTETKTPGELGKTEEENDRELEKKKAEIDALNKREGLIQAGIGKLQESKKGAAAGAGSILDWTPGSLLSEALGGPTASDVIGWGVGKVEIDPALKELEKQMGELKGKRAELAADYGDLLKRKDLIEKTVPIEQAPELGRSKELLELEKKRADVVSKIANEVATPYEKAEEKIRELNELRKEGAISDELFERGVNKAMGEAAKSAPDQVNRGVTGSGMYEAIRESIRSAEKNDNPQMQALKDQTDILRKSLTEMQLLNRNIEGRLTEEVGFNA